MKNLLIALILIAPFMVGAQNFKFGKVSKSELSETVDPRDSSANATVLYKNENIFFRYVNNVGFQQHREVHERIKIYNKEGYDWATKKIRLYNQSNSRSENLENLKGITYNLVGGKIEEEKLRKDGQFEEINNKYWKTESFTMPNINDGCVIEYQYLIVSPFTRIRDIDVQYEIPINNLELSISAPEYLIFNRHLNPKASFVPNLHSSTKANSIIYTTKSRSGNNGMYSKEKTNYSSNKIDYIDNVIIASETFIPALKSEPLIDNLDNYRSKVVMELTATKFPNEMMEYFSSTWDAVAKTIYEDPDFGSQLSKTSFFNKDIDALIAGETDKMKIAHKILNFVKSKVKWNGFVGYSSEKGTRKAFVDGAGNVADINLMLTAMYKYAGLQANPVLVSTKSNGIPLFPTRQGFNYVVCLVQTGDFNALVDATDMYSDFNVLPERALNWQGRLVREDGTSGWISMLPIMGSKDLNYVMASIDDDLTVKGKARNSIDNHYALSYRNDFKGMDPEQFINMLEKDKGEFKAMDLECENEKNLAKPVLINYSFESSDKVEQIGDKLLISPLLFLDELNDELVQDERIYPIDYKFPFNKKNMITLNLPEGYTVEAQPEDIRYQFGEGKGEYTYQIKVNGNIVQIVTDFNINSSFILADNYPDYKEFYNLVKSKQSEQLVLKKI